MKKIALFTPSKETYSETFIQAHIQGLDKVNWVYHDGEQPKKCDDVSFPSISKWKLRFYNFLHGKSWGWEQWSLYFSLRKHCPDLLYFEYGTTAVANLEVIKLLQIPIVINFHGFDISVYDVLAKNTIKYQELCGMKDARFVVVSKKMQERLIGLGASKERILYSPCGANIAFANIRADANANQFVMVGRMVEKKSPLSSIKAFCQLHQMNPSVRLVVIGTGPLMETCKNFVIQNNLMDAVNFKGILNPDQIQEVFKQSFCFIQHSLVAQNGDEEGTPVAVMEAMLSRLFVISTRHAGINDIVHPDMGVLVEENDVDAMANAMLWAINNRDQVNQMTERAKQFIGTNHTLDLHLKQINEFIG